jgi:hypothetical protein
MKISWACIIWLAIATNSINTKRAGDSPARTRTLILIDNASLYATHSQFFELFKTQGHALTIEQISVRIVTENLVKIEEDKEFLYDNIIFLASSMPELPDTTNFSLTRFFEKGNNIFFVVDNDVSPFFRSYFRKFGFGIDEAGSYLVDYTKAPNPTIPNLFQVDNFKDIDLISDGVEGPLLYNGVGLETSIFENTQITVFARGGLHTASVVYGVNGEKSISRLGKQNLLLLGIQVAVRNRRAFKGGGS